MDYAHNRADMRIVCECGRAINLPFDQILKTFGGIPQRLEQAKARLKCKRCFKRGRVTISPVATVRR